VEKKQVYHIFEDMFLKYKDVPMALYGLGINTKCLLEEAKTYNIIGIVANERIGEIVYGKEVMPIEAVLGKARIIVIVAQAKSVKVIYERIKHIENTGIEIYDLYGTRLKGLYDEDNQKEDGSLAFESTAAMSAYERMLNSSVLSAAKYASAKEDSHILNIFSRKAFHDHLSFVELRGKLSISNMYELGYYCFAPMTANYMAWLVKELEGEDHAIILFSSRDGYLLYKLYQLLKGKKPELKLPDAKYFYISRRAATIACIHNESDIAGIVASVLSLSRGSLIEILEQRLGIVLDKSDPILNRSFTDVLGKNEESKILARVLAYKDRIMENAVFERENYLKYTEKLNLDSYHDIFLFDLYSRGTNAAKLSKLLDRNVKLLCYAVKDFPNEYINSGSQFKSMFDSRNIMSGAWFRRGYQLFEIIYTSPEGQLKCFDKNGVPQFCENSQYNFDYIKEAQEGILSFINDLDRTDDMWYRGNFSLDMTDFMSGMMLPKYAIVSPDIRHGFLYQDSFSSDEAINIWDNII